MTVSNKEIAPSLDKLLKLSKILEETKRKDEALDVIATLDEFQMTKKLLKTTGIGKTMNKLGNVFDDVQVKSAARKLRKKWKGMVLQSRDKLPHQHSLRNRKPIDYREPSIREEEIEDEKPEETIDNEDEAKDGNLTVSAYRKRLVTGKKEMYKDPPVLPPLEVKVYSQRGVPPKRDKKTGEFKFPDFPEFRPNLSPEEVLQRGSFGGTYFRPIISAVLNRRISSKEALADIPRDWLKGLDLKTQVCSSHYDKEVNTYKVKCGGSLGMWESCGWISSIDPYGWYGHKKTHFISNSIKGFNGIVDFSRVEEAVTTLVKLDEGYASWDLQAGFGFS